MERNQLQERQLVLSMIGVSSLVFSGFVFSNRYRRVGFPGNWASEMESCPVDGMYEYYMILTCMFSFSGVMNLALGYGLRNSRRGTSSIYGSYKQDCLIWSWIAGILVFS